MPTSLVVIARRAVARRGNLFFRSFQSQIEELAAADHLTNLLCPAVQPAHDPLRAAQANYSREARKHPPRYNRAMSGMSAYQARLNTYVDGKDFLAMQREMPVLLANLIANVSAEKLAARPAPGKWSVTEIIAHLAEDELTSTWRYRQMIEQNGIALAGFNQELWAELGDYGLWSAADGLQMFRLLREVNLRMLLRLTSQQWDAFGIHAERGCITVRDLARHMAAHDRNHLDQIKNILG